MAKAVVEATAEDALVAAMEVVEKADVAKGATANKKINSYV